MRKSKISSICLAACLISAIAASGCSSADHGQKSSCAADVSRPSQRAGKMLASDIDSLNILMASLPPSTSDLEFNKLIRKYIPDGTGFDDAEETLKAACFIVAERPASGKERAWPYTDFVFAHLNLRPHHGFISDLQVELIPRNHLIFDFVGEVRVSKKSLTP